MSNSNSVKTKTLASLNRDEVASIHTIGNDIGDTYTTYAVVDGEGNIIAEGRVETKATSIQKLYGGLPRVRMVLETGTHSPWMSRLLESMGHEVIVANSRELHMIFKSKKKRDQVDARTLAKVGRFDISLLHPVHHRGEQVQRDLTLLRTRDTVVTVRTRLINTLRGSVKTFGHRLPSCSAEAFASKTRSFVPEALREALDPLFDTVEQLTERIRTQEKQIAKLIETTYPEAKRAMQIKGVGPLTAIAFVLLIEDGKRFTKSRTVGAYFGLVPALADSGTIQPQKHITKAGDAMMRRLLVNAGHYILGPFGEDCDLRRHGLAIAERGGKNAKKRAVVAVARKLAVLLHRLWVGQLTYEPLYNAQRKIAASVAA